MAKTTKKTLVLAFTTSAGENLKLTINAPKEGMEAEEISAAMDEIIASNVFGEVDQAAHKISAKYVIQQEDEVDLV